MDNFNIAEGSDNQDDKTVFGMDNSDITSRDFPTEGPDLDQLYRDVASYLRDGTARLITIARNDPSVNADTNNTIMSINSQGLQVVSKMVKARSDKIHDQVTSPANPSSDTEESEVKTFRLPPDMVDNLTAFKSRLDAFLTEHSQAQDERDE